MSITAAHRRRAYPRDGVLTGWRAPKGSGMDYYSTALIEIVIDLLFWVKRKFAKKPPVKGRPSVPSVRPR
jgi:hypothetical protein